ncbi:Hypothetical predicted protein [Olea europaea subsp. europaea]|uniref:Uncharacterized protein n=1 Tax=Olea europaea subsp. europaea TaxID=158383 RepID=A0A8S0VMW6_OLEEU|nr:Hypothetical predicted protein [Olea europaea subsp. europaea]
MTGESGLKKKRDIDEEPSSKKKKSYKPKLEMNQIVPLEAEKGEEYVVGLLVEGLGGDQDDDNFEHPVVGLKKLIDEGKTKSVDRAGRSTKKKNKGKINEDGVESLPDETDQVLAGNEEEMKDDVERLPDETDQMLVGNEEQTKDGVESLPDETDQVYNDFPSFSLGIEFELSCRKKDVEVPVRKSDKSVEKSDKAVEKSLRTVVKSDKAVEMNLDEEIEFHEDDWLRVDDIVARSLAKNQEDVASPSNEGRIELLEEIELKDDVWEKVVEVTAAIEAEIEIEEGNVEIIDIDDETPDMHLKR